MLKKRVVENDAPEKKAEFNKNPLRLFCWKSRKSTYPLKKMGGASLTVLIYQACVQ